MKLSNHLLLKFKICLPLMMFVFFTNTYAQNSGINFQGVARNANGVILASQKISLKFSIINLTENGAVEYAESRIVNANAQGIFSVIIGDTGAITTLGSFTNVNWKQYPKFLKVEMDPNAGNAFISMGITQLQKVPFAYYANGVNALNIDGVLPMTSGGTGTNSLSSFKSNLGLDLVNNTSDANKPISTLTQTSLDLKANINDVNVALASKANSSDLTAGLGLKANAADVNTALAIKANTSDVNVALASKANSSDLTAGLGLKANTADVTSSLALKVDKVTGKDLSSNDFTSAEKTKLASITGTNTGDQDLSSYATTAATNTALGLKANISDVNTSLGLKANSADLSLKESLSNKSTSITLGTSDVYYPTQNAVKTYVDNQISAGGVADYGITNIKIANNAVNTNKLADNSVSGTKIIDGSIVNAHINSTAAIDYSKLNLTGSVVASDISNTAAIPFSKLNIVKSDITNLGIPGSDQNTTYTAGNGLTLTGTIFSIGAGAITNTTIADGAVTAAKISDASISTSKIIDANVTTAKIANSSISTSKIIDGTIINADISNTASIDYSKLNLLGSIVESDISSTAAIPFSKLSITKSDINNLGIPSNSDLTTYSAGDGLTLTGTVFSIGSDVISSTNIKDNAITSSKIVDGAITSTKISGTLPVSSGGTGASSFSYGILKANGPNAFSVASSADFPTLNQSTTGQSASLSTSRYIHGGSFNGTGDVTNIIASNYGGTGNGFTKITGPTTNEKVFTLPNADATILTTNDLVTVAQGGTGTSTISGIIKGNGTSSFSSAIAGTDYLAPNGSANSLTNFPTLNQNTTGNAATATMLSTTRYIHGGAFDGTADVTNVISPIYGGTGSAYTNFYTTATDVKTFILPAASATILTSNNVVTVAQGGTSTNTLALNNVLLGNGTSALKTVAPGTSGNVLTSNGTTWASVAPSSGGVTALASIGSSANSNGASISGSTLTLAPADQWYGGLVSTGDQSFSGNKSFLGTISVTGKATIQGLTIGTGAVSYPDNTAVGLSVLASANSSSGFSTGLGSEALKSNTTGNHNTGVGYKSLIANTTANYNTAIGSNSLLTNTTGHDNSGLGYNALAANTTGHWNTAIGSGALFRSNSDYNTAIGYFALNSQTNGYQNTAVGYNALTSILSGYNNTAIGYNANVYDGYHNSTAVGANALCLGNNQLQLGDLNSVPYSFGTLTYRSDARDKINVRNTNLGLDFILNLRPVDFKYNYRDAYIIINKDGTETYLPNDSSKANKKYSHGFIAQEVKAIMDAKSLEFGGFNDMKESGGKDILSLGYTEFIAPMVKAIQEQQVIIDEQRKRLDAMEKLLNQLIQSKQ